MAHHEFDEARTIQRDKCVMDVITHIVRLPDGNLVRLTELQAVVFAVHVSQDTSQNVGHMANHATGVLFELKKANPIDKPEYPSISAQQIHSTRAYIKREKLPGWPK
jgi:hypothetical protein